MPDEHFRWVNLRRFGLVAFKPFVVFRKLSLSRGPILAEYLFVQSGSFKVLLSSVSFHCLSSVSVALNLCTTVS